VIYCPASSAESPLQPLLSASYQAFNSPNGNSSIASSTVGCIVLRSTCALTRVVPCATASTVPTSTIYRSSSAISPPVRRAAHSSLPMYVEHNLRHSLVVHSSSTASAAWGQSHALPRTYASRSPRAVLQRVVLRFLASASKASKSCQ